MFVCLVNPIFIFTTLLALLYNLKQSCRWETYYYLYYYIRSYYRNNISTRLQLSRLTPIPYNLSHVFHYTLRTNTSIYTTILLTNPALPHSPPIAPLHIEKVVSAPFVAILSNAALSPSFLFPFGQVSESLFPLRPSVFPVYYAQIPPSSS